MGFWKQEFSLEGINTISQDTMVEYLGIEFTEIGEDYLCAKMPVTNRTVQPLRLLHGGASAVLVETVGSVASILCLPDITKQQAVGLELNVSHLRSVSEGAYVMATCYPVRIGRSIHVWNVEVKNPEGQTTCYGRLTMSIKNI